MVITRFINSRSSNFVSTLFKTYSTSASPAFISVNVGSELSKKTKTPKPVIKHEGDDGKSTTASGIVHPKDHEVFHAIGITEELTSSLGLAKEFAQDACHEYVDKLKRIQTVLIDMSTSISKYKEQTASPLRNQYTKELEEWIHEYSEQLPPVDEFIIPGGGKASASLHVSRSICRKAERTIVPLVRNGYLHREAQVYLNRLADFLFTVARMAAKYDKRTESVYVPTPDPTTSEKQSASSQSQSTQT